MTLEMVQFCRMRSDPSEVNLSSIDPTKRIEIWKQKLKENKSPGSLSGKAELQTWL